MRFKKGILITLLLLIVLTIGSVSANEDTNIGDALTDDISDEVSLDASYDEEISEDSDGVIASSENDEIIDGAVTATSESESIDDEVSASSESEILADEQIYIDVNSDFNINDDESHFAWINLPLGITEGKAVVAIGESIFESPVNLGDSSKWWRDNEGDGHYTGGIKPSFLNWGDSDNGVIALSFLNQDDETLAYREYEFTIDGDNVHLKEGTSKDNFNIGYLATHRTEDNLDGHICDVWIHDVDEGSLILSIENPNGEIEEYEMPVEGNYAEWNFQELDIIEGAGKYIINLTYTCDDKNIIIKENHVFALTHLNYETCEGYIYIYYPFNVIKFYSQYDEEEDSSTYIKVFVNNEEAGDPSGENPSRWTLEDLGITQVGDYTITIKAFNGEEPIEDFSYDLNVFSEFDNFVFYSNQVGVESEDLDNPVLYLLCNGEFIGEHLTLRIRPGDAEEFEDIDEFYAIDSKSWTLEDLEIDRNNVYDIKLFNEDDNEIASAWLNVNGIISEDSFGWFISSHESRDDDWNTIIDIWFNSYVIREGTITLSIENPNGDVRTTEKDIDGPENIRWELGELLDEELIDENGEYKISIIYSNGDKEVPLVEDEVFVLTHMNYNIYQGEIYIHYPFDVIRFYGEYDEEDDSSTYIKVYVGDAEEPIELGVEGLFRCTLEDLGITEAGEYNIRIEGFRGEEKLDDFTYKLYVLEEFDNIRLILNDLGVESWELEDPVLYIYSPNEMIGTHLIMFIDDEEFSEFDISSSLMSWTLEDLGIDHNNGYNIQLFDDDGNWIDEKWLNVNGIISEENFNWDIHSHESMNDRESEIIQIWIDGVHEGAITLSIEAPNGDIQTEVISLDETDYIRYELQDLDIFDEAGTYYINLTYLNEDKSINLVEDKVFTLTELDYTICEDVYIEYPFDVIRFYSEEDDEGEPINYVKVYVNEVEKQFGDENPLRWNLDDLGIDAAGDYTITIKAYEGDDCIEEFTYNLHIYDDLEYPILYSDQLGIERWEINDPILYLVCPDNLIGESFRLYVFDDFIGEYEFESKMSWTLDQLRIDHDDGYEISIYVEDDDRIADTWLNVWCLDGSQANAWIWDTEEDGILYNDNESPVIRVDMPYTIDSGILYLFVDDELLYTSKVYPERSYEWNLQTLNITSQGDYDVKLVLFDGNENETLAEQSLEVTKFNNDTFRAKVKYVDDTIHFSFFCTNEDNGIITVLIHRWDDEENGWVIEEVNYTINNTFKNNWTNFVYWGIDRLDVGDGHYEVKLNGEEKVMEQAMDIDTVGLNVYSDNNEDWERIFDNSGDFAQIFLPYNRSIENCTINITSGDYVYHKKLSEFELYEWASGSYKFSVTFDDLDDFETLSDKDVISIVFTHNNGKLNDRRCLERNGNDIIIHHMDDQWEGIRLEILTVGEDEADEEGDEEDEGGEDGSDEPQIYFAEIFVPADMDLINAIVKVSSGEKILFNDNIEVLEKDFDYLTASYRYRILIENLNLELLNDKDLINVTLISDDEILKEVGAVYRFDGENSTFYVYEGKIYFDVHYGNLDDPEFGMGEHDGSFIVLTIPEALNIDEGTIEITLDNGTVLFTKSLSSFNDTSDSRFELKYSNYYQGWEYVIMANETIYNKFPNNQNMTFTFRYGDNSIIHKGIRVGNELEKIIVPTDVLEMFDVVIPTDVLIDDGNFAVSINGYAANRQSIYFELGGGYFSVYVNGIRIEDLGRLVRIDGETELDLFLLCSNNNGVQHLNITLTDLGITDNGVYEIKFTHTPEDDSHIHQLNNNVGTGNSTFGPGTGSSNAVVETVILNQNVTLTSNVKANYTNESVEWLTGYGIDPVLMYLDTYYGDISDTTGTITVYNEANVAILTKDITDLTYEDGRYSLRYSDFENKEFGDKITVKYSDGNERNGETEFDVKWKDLEPEDFNVNVEDDVDNYYGNFVNMNIPEIITTGQVVVTIKFKNNNPHNISDMDVSTDFDSQAVYTFNVADIKNHYENGNFALSLSDLGFYEIDGDYEVDVKFTGDGSSFLNVTNKTFDVALLQNILININESSRYGIELPFASAQIFEPKNVYAELYVDGVLYDHKTFEKGVATLVSSSLWTPGTHTAEVKVFDAEFGSVLSSLSKEFEVLTQSEDIVAVIPEVFDDNNPVIISFNAPKEGSVYTKTEKGIEKVFEVINGDNNLDLGVLGQGDHTIWVLYNETLDDGSIAFYNNYLNVSVGGWMILPDPLVLNDEDTIKFNFGEGSGGNVTINIDNGLLTITIPVENGSAEFKLDESIFDNDPEHKYGKHTYEISYSGDETHEAISKSGEFTVAYLFKDNLIKEGFPYRQYYIIIIKVPGDATGNVTININGVEHTAAAENGQAVFNVTGYEIGNFPVNISYSGDDKYPESSYENTLSVSYYGVVCDMIDGKRIVSLSLPSDATGNLVIYNDNRGTKLYSKALENGYAEIDLSDLGVGIYEIRAVYEGGDFDVRPYSEIFKVMPYVYIEQNKRMGDDVKIFVDLDDSTGYLLIVMDGLSPVLQEIKNGKVNYTLSTKGYSYGNHTVYFEYFGESFDKNVFKEYDESTGRYGDPIEYGLSILGKQPQMTINIDENGNIIVDLPKDVNGVLSVDVNGQHIVDVDVTKEGTYNINGHEVIVKHLANKTEVIIKLNEQTKKKVQEASVMDVLASLHGSKIYVPTSKSAHKKLAKPKIIAKDLSIVYSSSKKFSVTVYGMNGKVAKGVLVTFLINNKVYKKVKTNAKGVATVAISKKPGTYKITAKASGVSITKKLKVKHVLTLKKVKVKKSAKKLVLKATLKKVDGKRLKNKKVTFKFNGKKYKVKTNKKGVAKVTIKQKVLKKLKVGKKVKYQATYLKDTVKKSVKVKK